MFMNSGVIADPATDAPPSRWRLPLSLALPAALPTSDHTRGSIEPFIANSAPWESIAVLRTWLSQGAHHAAVPGHSIPVLAGYFGAVLGIPVPIVIIVGTSRRRPPSCAQNRYGRHVWPWIERGCGALFRISVERVRTMTYVIQGLCVPWHVCFMWPRLDRRQHDGLMWELRPITHRGRRAPRCAAASADSGAQFAERSSRDRRQHHAAFEFRQSNI